MPRIWVREGDYLIGYPAEFEVVQEHVGDKTEIKMTMKAKEVQESGDILTVSIEELPPSVKW